MFSLDALLRPAAWPELMRTALRPVFRAASAWRSVIRLIGIRRRRWPECRARLASFGASEASISALRQDANTPMERIFYDHDGRPIDKWAHYLEIYDRVLAPYRARPVGMLEIGVLKGGSLQLWRKYLGPKAIIFGIDVDEGCAALDTADLPVRIGSQNDPAFLRRIVAEMGGIDIVLDDGSHLGRHQIASFNVLFPLLSDGGLYIVEDLHASYADEWEGGLRRGGTMIEHAKRLVDDMHTWYHDQISVYAQAHREIASISFYDSMLVIAKARRGEPCHVSVGQNLP